MSTGWRLVFGLGLIVVGALGIMKRDIPLGVEGKPPAYHVRGVWAVVLGIAVIAIGLVVVAWHR